LVRRNPSKREGKPVSGRPYSLAALSTRSAPLTYAR
jgi:hypothetical protein